MEKPNHKRKKSQNKEGGDLIDSVKSLLFGVKDLSQRQRNFLKQYGDRKIVSVVVQREPVNSSIIALLNGLTLGGLKKALARSKYENLFHLSVLLVLEGNINVRLEKNEILTLSIQRKRLAKGAEVKVIDEFPKDVSLNEAIDKTKKLMGDRFAKYDSKHNNCQHFILGFLHANGINYDAYNDFVKQSVSDIFTSNPALRTITRVITDPAARVSNALQGGEIEMNNPDSLKKHNYHLELPRKDRRKALQSAVNEYGKEKVLQKLMAVHNLTSVEANKKKFKEDINWVKRNNTEVSK